MPEYSYPEGYLDLTPEQKAEICNGCGAKGLLDFVPDHILGACFEEPCNIHDYGYSLGNDKRGEDRRFLFNMSVASDTDDPILYGARMEFAWRYFRAVSLAGGLFIEDTKEG